MSLKLQQKTAALQIKFHVLIFSNVQSFDLQWSQLFSCLRRYIHEDFLFLVPCLLAACLFIFQSLFQIKSNCLKTNLWWHTGSKLWFDFIQFLRERKASINSWWWEMEQRKLNTNLNLAGACLINVSEN